MARHHGPVLVDTNVILECWRIGAWKALTERIPGGDGGGLRDRDADRLSAAPARAAGRTGCACEASLEAVQKVTDAERAGAIVRDALFGYLDPGEASLWAHALTRSDAWVLCGPDKASLRFGVRLGFRDRLVALESLLDAVGHRPKEALRSNYTDRLACTGAERDRAVGGSQAIMTAPVRSLDVRSSIVNAFRRDLVGTRSAGLPISQGSG